MRAPELDSYLLCATPRTGSTLLCGLLESSDVAGHPASYFNRKTVQVYADEWGVDRPADGRIDDAFARAARRVGSTANGVFGARIMAETLPELLDDLAAVSPPGLRHLDLLTARFGRLGFVHLRRDDVVAQAVSWAKSLQTHYWHPGEDVLPGAQEPHYDADLLDQLVATIARHEAAWAAWFASLPIVPFEVTYEQLAAEPSRTAHAVLDHLGLEVPPGRELTTGHRRQADDLNAAWISAYKAGRNS